MILTPVTTGGQRVRRGLVGVKNGVNLVFSSPGFFVHSAGLEEWAIRNGQILEEGVGNDYVASESGGAGTGYDTITMALPPLADENLELIYLPA